MRESKSFPGSSDRESPGTIFVKRDFFEAIESGRKTLELRLARGQFANIKAGDTRQFRTSGNDSVAVRIVGVRRYASISLVLGSEDMDKLAPGVTQDELSRISQTIFNESDVRKHGLVLIEFEKV